MAVGSWNGWPAALNAIRKRLESPRAQFQRDELRRVAGAPETAVISPEQSEAILDLNDALERLASLDSRAALGVELRYFGGLNQDEIAEVLKISTVTVRRDWVFSKAWLYQELGRTA